MFTKVHTKVLDVECKLHDASYDVATVQALGVFSQTTFRPVITQYQYVPGSSYSIGCGKSLLDSSTEYIAYDANSGVLNTRAVGSVWCDCTITSASEAVLNSLLLSCAGWNDSGKKPQCIDLYRIEGGKYILHQTLYTKRPAESPGDTELLSLTVPIQFNGTIALRVVARSPWYDYYLWVTEIYLKGFTIL